MGTAPTAQPAQTRKRPPAGPARTERDLCEASALVLGELPAGQNRVDRERKIIRRVKMVAAESRNAHDVEGVDGTDYLYEALARVRDQYEGAPAYSNHPPRDNPDQERRNEDALGIYRDIEVQRYKANPELGEVYGDLHLVTHPLTEALLDAAEKETLHGVYMLSHNARGAGEVRGRRYRINDISKVRSCDVVTRGAGTRNFFESQERRAMAKVHLHKVILESKTLPKRVKAALLEMDDMMAAEVPAEAPAEGDWKQHLTDAIAALVRSDDPSSHDMAKKILAMLHPEKAEDLEEEQEGGGGGGSDDEAAKKKKAEETDYKESLAEATELFALVFPDRKIAKPLLESAARLKGRERTEYVKSLREVIGPAGPGIKPPPGPPRQPATPAGTGAGGNLAESERASKACEDLLGRQLY